MSIEVVVAMYLSLVILHALFLGITGRGINGHLMVAISIATGIDDNVGALLLAVFCASEILYFFRRLGKE